MEYIFSVFTIIQHKLSVCFSVSGVEPSPPPSGLASWYLGVRWTWWRLFSLHKTIPLYRDTALQPCGTTSHQLHVRYCEQSHCTTSHHSLHQCWEWWEMNFDALLTTPSSNVTAGLEYITAGRWEVKPLEVSKSKFFRECYCWRAGGKKNMLTMMLDKFI